MLNRTTQSEPRSNAMAPELAILRHCQDRVLEREGIPMVLALVSEVREVPEPSGPTSRSDGERLADAMDRFRQALLPSGRDGDMGSVISVLQAVAYDDFGSPAEPLPEAARVVARQEVGEAGAL